MKTKGVIYIILTVLWMSVIFGFSAKNSDESSDDSAFVGRKVCELFVPGFNSLSMDKQQEYIDLVDHPVRKTAHFVEYAILGFLIMGAVTNMLRYPRFVKAGALYYFLLATVFSFVYASIDEFHQLFVSGRSGQFTDVLIDTSGAAFGALLLALIMHIQSRRCRN